MGKIRVGIVGTGEFAGQHINVWRSIERIELSGVHGGNSQRLNAFSQKFRIKEYNDYARLIEVSDIVDVVSANHTHCDYAAQAIINGRPVIIEKPLDVVYEKASKLYELSQNKGIVCSVVSQFRFQKAFQKLKNILDTKRLGNIETCRLCVVWPRTEKYFNRSGGWKKEKSMAGGGVLLHQCIHFIDLLHWFFGKAINVDGRKDCCDAEKVEKSFWGEIEFERGTVCQFYLTVKPFPYSYQELEVFGSKETLIVDGTRIFENLYINPLKDILRRILSYSTAVLKSSENSNTLLRRQFINVIESMSKGISPLVTVEDGLVALHTALGLYKAAELRKKIYLNNPLKGAKS